MAGTILFSAVGIVLVVAGLPLWRGRVRPNQTYGFRTAVTLSNERIGYAVNKVAGAEIMVIGFCAVIATLALHVCAIRPQVASLVMLAIVGVPLIAVLLHGLVLSRRMTR